jgi:hypothetical protein
MVREKEEDIDLAYPTQRTVTVDKSVVYLKLC